MFKEYEINKEEIDKTWKSDEERQKIKEWLSTLEEFKSIPVYGSGVELFSFCFKEHEKANGNLFMVDYGYALDAESIEKYLLSNYGDSENEYIVSAHLMPMDYEKYYKNGTFINFDGINTNEDFYTIDNYEELEDKAQFKSNWIAFTIYDINKNSRGNDFK